MEHVSGHSLFQIIPKVAVLAHCTEIISFKITLATDELNNESILLHQTYNNIPKEKKLKLMSTANPQSLALITKIYHANNQIIMLDSIPIKHHRIHCFLN